ncbi:MAG: TonB family protein [Blastocatellia bacterium]
MKKLSIALIFCLLSLCISNAVAQEKFRHRGVELYQQGKYAEAVSILDSAVRQKEFKADAEIWNYLGLSFLEINEVKKSRKAFETAVKFAPMNSTYRVNLAYAYLLNRQINRAQTQANKAIEIDPKNFQAYQLRGSANLWERKIDAAERDADTMIGIEGGNPAGYILKSETLVARLGKKLAEGSTIGKELDLLRQATDVLSLGVETCKNHSAFGKLKDEHIATRTFYDYFQRWQNAEISTPTAPVDPDPTITPLKIISKQKPSYTDQARQAGIMGTIRVAVLFGASGRVEYVLVLSRLGYGLDQQAVAAARKISFEPQRKDGIPVSVVRLIEFGFAIY